MYSLHSLLSGRPDLSGIQGTAITRWYTQSGNTKSTVAYCIKVKDYFFVASPEYLKAKIQNAGFQVENIKFSADGRMLCGSLVESKVAGDEVYKLLKEEKAESKCPSIDKFAEAQFHRKYIRFMEGTCSVLGASRHHLTYGDDLTHALRGVFKDDSLGESQAYVDQVIIGACRRIGGVPTKEYQLSTEFSINMDKTMEIHVSVCEMDEFEELYSNSSRIGVVYFSDDCFEHLKNEIGKALKHSLPKLRLEQADSPVMNRVQSRIPRGSMVQCIGYGARKV